MRALLGMVLGSGFQHALSEMTVEREIPYGEIPGFPQLVTQLSRTAQFRDMEILESLAAKLFCQRRL